MHAAPSKKSSFSRRKFSKKAVSFLIVTATILAVGGIKYGLGYFRLGIQKVEMPRAKGNPQAKVQIVEYVDFQCPACAQGSVYLKDFMALHPGFIYLQLKHFPLPMHKHGFLSAYYAQCAAEQSKFWPFVDQVFERQVEWSKFNDPYPFFKKLAQELKFNMPQLEMCMREKKILEIVEREKKEGKALGVNSTPTYFINNTMVVGQKSLSLELERLLSEQEK